MQQHKYRFSVHQSGNRSLVTEGQKNLAKDFIACPSAYYLQKKDLSDEFTLEEITIQSGNDK